MTKKWTLVSIALLMYLSFTESGYSQPTAMENDLKFLYGAERQEGSSGSAGSSRITDYYSEAEVRATLRTLATYKVGTHQSQSQDMKDQNVDKTLYIIHKIETKFRAGEDITADLKTLLSYRKSDGGWGHLKRSSTNFHTAYAVRALSTIKYSDQKIIDTALSYLKSRQNKDGGWGFRKGDESSVLMAGAVLLTFLPFKEAVTHQTAINKGTAYLLSMQNPDGGWSVKRKR